MDNTSQPKFNNRVVIVTGELSGEIHAHNLIECMKNMHDFYFSGIGSEKLRKSGVDIVYDYKNISLTGITELFTKAHHILSAYRMIKKHLKETKPSLVILVDFPGLNLRIAEYAKNLGIHVIYFIPPQIWAWHKKRVYKIKKSVDLVLCILPFEKKFYDEYGIDARFVGHPFANTIKPTFGRDAFLEKIDTDKDCPILTIMPGSRENEISRHMPIILKSVDIIEKRLPDIKILLPVAENIPYHIIDNYIKDRRSIIPLRGLNYDALYNSDAAIIASGSATLEAAILGTPTVVIYKISLLSYIIARMLVDVQFISLPNIIAEKEVFPEFIQQLSPEKIAEKVLYMLNNGRDAIEKDIEKIKMELGSLDSYKNAGQEIIKFLEQRYGTLS